MRFHFPDHQPGDGEYTPVDLAYKALRECQKQGTIADHLQFKWLTSHGRRGGGSAIEIQFETYERDRGRRTGNSGSYGAMYDGTYTATYDEWGHFIAKLYDLAYEIGLSHRFFVGSPKNPTYHDRMHFHEQTGRTYDPTYVDYVGMYGDDYPFRTGRNQIGRRGYGRIWYDNPQSRYAEEDPRTAQWLRDFQSGKVF